MYVHATIVTVDAQNTIRLDGALLVNADRIVAIAKSADLLSQVLPNVEIVDASGYIILPGLINTHAHLTQSLLRGLAENVSLHSWLCDSIWPLEANYEGKDGYVAARLTIAEMLKSGTTCFLEAMLTHRSGFDNVVRAVEEMGIRGCLVRLSLFLESSILQLTVQGQTRQAGGTGRPGRCARQGHLQHVY